jgi:CRISPR-associated protein Cas2
VPRRARHTAGIPSTDASISQRDFYLAAYDVAHPRRLVAALALVRGFATGGQKSVHKIFLTRGERFELLHDMALLLDESEDRLFLLRLDPRARTYALGIRPTTVRSAESARDDRQGREVDTSSNQPLARQIG